MLSRLTREFNNIFIDNTPVTGAQSIVSSYGFPLENVKYIGSNNNDLKNVPVGIYVGALELNSLFLNQDQFIKYTGDFGANLNINYGNNQYVMNSGFLTDYTFTCNVGSIPAIATKWNFYGEFGSGISPKSNFNIDDSKLNIVAPGDIEIGFNDLSTEKINNITLGITCPRLPLFDCTKVKPVEVQLQYPLDIKLAFGISLNQYKLKNLFDYPYKNNSHNISIYLKKHNTSNLINYYTFNNMNLLREDYNLDVDGSVVVQLTYGTTIHRWCNFKKG